jgi:hypothetical protein
LKRSHPTRTLLATAVAVAGLLVAAPGALAAGTVTSPFPGSLNFEAGTGDTNDMTVNASFSSITITDTNAINESLAQCEGGGTNTVTCTIAANDFVTLSLDNQDDEYVASGPRGVSVSGGQGSDTLIGSDVNSSPESLSGDESGDEINSRNAASALSTPAPADFVSGDDGNDDLVTGNGPDQATGGDGVDTISTGAGDDVGSGGTGDGDEVDLGDDSDLYLRAGGDGNNDIARGGSGNDKLLPVDSTNAPIPDAFSADLAAGTLQRTNNGPESSSATGFEDYASGLPPLLGPESADTVSGTDGSNVIETSGGADAIDPRGGTDTVSAGSGNDSIEARDGAADRIACSSGNDTVQADQFDEVNGCESVTRTTVGGGGGTGGGGGGTTADGAAPRCTVTGVPARVRRRTFVRRGARPRTNCNEPSALNIRLIGRVRRIRGQVVLQRAGDLVLAERNFRLGSGARTATLKVPRAMLRALGRRFTLRLRVEATDAAGNRSVSERRIRIR